MSEVMVASALVFGGLLLLAGAVFLLASARREEGLRDAIVSTNSALLRALRDSTDSALAISEQHLQAMKIRNWSDWNLAAAERDGAIRSERELLAAEPFQGHPDAESFAPGSRSPLRDDDMENLL